MTPQDTQENNATQIFYTIQLAAPCITWTQRIESEDDIPILEAVFKKLLRDSIKFISEKQTPIS